jgi:plasmid stability protein
MRNLLEAAVKPRERIKLGSKLADIGRRVKLTDQELAVFDSVRDKSPARAASLG